MLGSRLIRSARLLLCTFLLSIQSQAASDLFKARYETRKAITLDRTFTSSGSISLDGLGTIYALSIDATITQPRESSFVRVVLEDKDGHQYLVAECDRFRNDTSIIQVSEYCEETERLDGVVPERLKYYLAGDATLTITGIHISEYGPTRAESSSMGTAETIKKAQVQDIVDRINEYNVRHGKLWCAGVTKRSLRNYSNRTEFMGEQDAYLSNLQYYAGGIYDIGEMDNVPARDDANNSPYVPDFDWRNRHGKNWITHVKDQGNSGYCVAFAINGMLEARTNLYFNQKIDVNLSEQDIVYNYARHNHDDLNLIYSNGMDTSLAFGDVVNDGVLDSTSVPFIDDTLYVIPPRPTGNECIQISSRNVQYKNGSNFVDIFKNILIHQGPVVSGFRAVVEGGKIQRHATTLVGYHTINAGDTIHQVKNPIDGGLFSAIIVPDNSPFIGQTYWVMKDSYGEDMPGREGGGYLYLLFISYENMSELNYTTSPITSRNHTDDDIVVEDADGDGYFNWGIGPRPNNRLPAWAEQEEDGDDSNRFKGAMDEYGHMAEISYPYGVYVVTHDMTDQELIDSLGISRFLRQSVRVNQGVTFTVTGPLAFYRNKSILLQNNSTLVIDGGTLIDPSFHVYGNGHTIRIIINGGKMECYRKEEVIIPPNIQLEINEGSINE